MNPRALGWDNHYPAPAGNPSILGRRKSIILAPRNWTTTLG